MNERMRVLVIEDEPRLRELLARAIPDMDFDVSAASCGHDALALMHECYADIIVLDLQLPDFQGLDLYEQIHRTWTGTQFIVLTGFGSLEAAKSAIRLDVVDFLTKPASLGEIEVALDRARRRRKDVLNAPGEDPQPVEVERESSARLRDLERDAILESLRRNNGNRAPTAEELGISLRTLYYRLAEYEKQGFAIEGR